MSNSMTGYGSAESVLDGKRIVVEIKSLNHRYLETYLRLSGIFASLEAEIKKKITSKFARGKIEVAIRVESNGSLEKGAVFDLNIPLLRNYNALLTRMKQEFNLKDEITLSTLASFRDVFVTPEDDITALWPKVDAMLDEAIATLMIMRDKEGALLCRDLQKRIAIVQSLLDNIRSRGPKVLTAYQKRLTERIKELLGDIKIDESRLMQEVAIMAEKSDITEEMVRLRSHIDQLIDLLQSDEAIGRKVDFLIQEMSREVNTIGSKSSDVEISRSVIDIKSELAKIREQAQNFE